MEKLRFLLEKLQKLQEQFPDQLSNARGRGLMCAIDFPNGEERDAARNYLYCKNLIILGCGDQSIRFRPHLNVRKEEIDLAISKFEEMMNDISLKSEDSKI